MEAIQAHEANSGSHFFPQGMPQKKSSAFPNRKSEKAESVVRPSSRFALMPEDSWFWGEGQITRELREQMSLAAHHDANVLIIGETGSGKEWVAHQLHSLRRRRLGLSDVEGPFVSVNSGAIPETLIESILFGHERGAFTSARERQLGKFELARRGSLFLDEIQTLPLACQIKLLRVLQSKTVERLGAKEPQSLDCQILAASNVPLELLVQEGKFRKDLYYRLNIFPLYIPALRHRREDIPRVAAGLLKRISVELRHAELQLSEGALASLVEYDWPGNIRELEHALFYAAVRSRNVIEKDHLPWTLTGNLVSYLANGDWKV